MLKECGNIACSAWSVIGGVNTVWENDELRKWTEGIGESLLSSPTERNRKGKEMERNKTQTSTPYLITTGTANKLPTRTQLIKNATIADLTTISHCARIITGLNTLVKGTANAGTAFINRKRLRTLISLSSELSPSSLLLLDFDSGDGILDTGGACEYTGNGGSGNPWVWCFSKAKFEGADDT